MNLLAVAQVAERLAISRPLVYELVNCGELPHVPCGKSKAYRFDSEDIVAFVRQRKVQNEGKKPNAPRPRLRHIKL